VVQKFPPLLKPSTNNHSNCLINLQYYTLKSFFFSFSVFRQLLVIVEFQTSKSFLQSLHGYGPGASSNLFVDNEINLYKKIIIEEMIRPYFISTVPAVVVAVGTYVDDL